MGEGVRPATIAPTRVGGLYRDGAARITPALQRRVDAIAQDLRLFDFGRFDARFDCLADLASGEFTIMEVNRAGSQAIEAWDSDIGVRPGVSNDFC